MKTTKAATIILAGLFATPAAFSEQGTVLASDTVRIVCDAAGVRSISVRPAGEGDWIDTLWAGPRVVGGDADAAAVIDIAPQPGGGIATISGARISRSIDHEPRGAGLSPLQITGDDLVHIPIDPGPERLSRVAVHTPTWSTTDSRLTFRVRAGAPDGPIVFEMPGRPVVDNEWVELDFSDDPLPGGTIYYVELSEAQGTIGLWTHTGGATGGELLVGGQERPATRGDVNWTTLAEHEATLTVELTGSAVTVSAEADGFDPELEILWPWERDGYETEDPDVVPFRYLLNGLGYYMPVHQFKRRPHHPIAPFGQVYVSGTRGFDANLSFPAGIASMLAEMEPDALTLGLDATSATVTFGPPESRLPDHFPVFTASDADAASLLTEFLYSHGLNFGAGVHPGWGDWMAIIHAWQPGPLSGHLRMLLAEHYRVTDEGYVYTWGGQAGWPFPFADADGDGLNDIDTRHFSTNPCFILGAWRHGCWSRDEAFIEAVMPRARRAMEYMLEELDGRSGLIVCPDVPEHSGKDGAYGNNYWDILPFGHLDAFANAYFAGSLEAMADLETWAGDEDRAEELLAVRDRCQERYTDVFWNDEAGRFVGCVDVDGVAHDYGFSFVNLDAMAYGLASEEQATRIYDWLESGITSSGEADAYSRWIFAPRANTLHNPARSDEDPELPPWWSGVWHGTAWEDQCQNGGAILYTSWADIQARLWLRGPDDAWQRLMEILERYAMPDHLSGGDPLFLGERPQGGPGGVAGQVGVEGEFPESGMVPSSFVTGFLGMEARSGGLHIQPALPTDLEWAGVEGAWYADGRLDLTAEHGELRLEWTPEEGDALSLAAAYEPGQTAIFRPWLGEPGLDVVD